MKTILSCLVFLVASSISVQAMIDYSRHFDQSSPNIWTDKHGKHNIVRMVNDQRLQEVEYMLQNGADVNHTTGSHVRHQGNLLTLAIFQKCTPMIQLLCKHGATKPKNCTTENFNSFVRKKGTDIEQIVAKYYPTAASISTQDEAPVIQDTNARTSRSGKIVHKIIRWTNRNKIRITCITSATLIAGLAILKYKSNALKKKNLQNNS